MIVCLLHADLRPRLFAPLSAGCAPRTLDTIVTPGKIYHALGKRADCGGCMKLFVAEMRAADGFVAGQGLPCRQQAI